MLKLTQTIKKEQNIDFLKGALLAVLTSVITSILQMISLVPPVVDWKAILMIALSTFLAYILKQFSTNNDGELLKGNDPYIDDIGGGTAGTIKP